MYFWRVDLLIQDLRNNRVSSEDKFKYYLLTAVCYELSLWPLLFDSSPVTLLNHIEVALSVLLTGAGICYAHKKYGPGEHFIEQVICLGWPIMLRALVLPVPIFLGAAAAMGWMPSDASINALGTVAMVGWLVYYYWRLGQAMEQLSAT